MVILTTVLACFLAALTAIVVIQSVRIQEMRRKSELEVGSANKTVRMLVNLLQNPAPATPPDRLIGAIGDALHKIVVGTEPTVTNSPQDDSSEQYYPDVEFDEWLGTEGIPPTAGWWSPTPSNGGQTANANFPNVTPNTD